MMKYFKYSLIITICLLSIQKEIYSQNWITKISAYFTKIEEVEKLISVSPVKDQQNADDYTYHLSEGNLQVTFSLGNCIKGIYGAWDLEKGIIIQASFYPKEFRKISYYEKDIRNFKKEFTMDALYLRNGKRGIQYVIHEGKVSEILFFGADNINPVKCKE